MIPSKFQALSELITKEEHLELNITTVGLWGCNIGSGKLAELCSNALAKAGVRRLEISEVKKEIKKKAVLAIADLFHKKKSSSKGGAGVNKKGKGVKYSLMIQRCNISHKNITLLLKSLQGSSLSELSLFSTLHQSSDQSYYNLSALSDFLAHTPKLTNLYLSGNDLDVESCLPLAQGIVLNCLKGNLKILNLNHNRIGTKGLALLCEALKDHAKLESLFLDDNMLDTDAS